MNGWRKYLGVLLACCPAAVLALPDQATAQAPAISAAPAQEAPPAATTGPDYLIGPGDTIQVFVWRNPELSVSVPVRPDGKVSTPLIEDMVAVGKTPSELARDMEAKLAEKEGDELDSAIARLDHFRSVQQQVQSTAMH